MMLKVDARGDACPLPVVKAKKAISELKGAGEVEVLVDNEIAVQNLTKMAQQKGYQYSAEKLAEREYRVLFTVGEASETPTEEAPACAPDTRTDTVVAISSDKMAQTDAELFRLWKCGSYAVAGTAAHGGKLTAPPQAQLERWMTLADIVLIEADGCNMMTGISWFSPIQKRWS